MRTEATELVLSMLLLASSTERVVLWSSGGESSASRVIVK